MIWKVLRLDKITKKVSVDGEKKRTENWVLEQSNMWKSRRKKDVNESPARSSQGRIVSWKPSEARVSGRKTWTCMTKADKSSKTGTENPQQDLATVRSLAILTRPTWMNWLEQKSDQWGFRKKWEKRRRWWEQINLQRALLSRKETGKTRRKEEGTSGTLRGRGGVRRLLWCKQ